jgi:HPt (histidine-containing phosphotransfer) domain-containing protein
VTAEREEQVRGLLAELWLGNRPVALRRMAVVRAALERLGSCGLRDPERDEALAEAHRLKGLLGTYGFAAGSDLAEEAEQVLEAGSGGVATPALVARWVAYTRILAGDSPDG